MEVFDGAWFVRLRCVERRRKYLAADVDGFSVRLSGQRRTHNTVWAVEHADGPDGPSVLLRGAYGRYLFAAIFPADRGVVAAQADLQQQVPPPEMLWHAIERQGTFVIRCGLGRYLRANGKYFRWRREITVVEDDDSTMMQWAIEIVPLMFTRPGPGIFEPIYQLTHQYRSSPTEGEVSRLIRYVRCEPNGNINELAWSATDLVTNKLMELRFTLAKSFDIAHWSDDNTTLCIRAGRFGQFTPLLIDLPVGNNRIDIVIVIHGTPADNSLMYPDLNAP